MVSGHATAPAVDTEAPSSSVTTGAFSQRQEVLRNVVLSSILSEAWADKLVNMSVRNVSFLLTRVFSHGRQPVQIFTSSKIYNFVAPAG